MLAALNVGSVDDKEKFAVFQKAVKKLGQMSVDHFEKASVVGYVEGRHESVTIGMR
jgi:hypothetical protein